MGRKTGRRLKKDKHTLVFDESARKDWLTGFGKRKKARQQKAKDDLAALLKQEKLRQKDEIREKMKKAEAKYLSRLEDVEKIIKESTKSYDCAGKTVEITEFNLTDSKNYIGENTGEDNSEHEEGETEMKNSSGSEKEEENSDTEASTVPKRLPKKMSNKAVNIEKRLYKLNNKGDLRRAKRLRKKNVQEGKPSPRQRHMKKLKKLKKR